MYFFTLTSVQRKMSTIPDSFSIKWESQFMERRCGREKIHVS